jgi:hypothetical protein
MKKSVENKNKIFKVPENYFDHFPQRVMMQITELPDSNIKPKFIVLIKKQFAIAAIFISFFIFSYVLIKYLINLSTQTPIKPKNNIEAYYYYLDNINENEIAELYFADKAENGLSYESLEEYMINENINDDIIFESNK